MKRINLVVICILFVFNCFAQEKSRPHVIAYFSGKIEQLDSIDVNKISHLIFCFGHLDDQSRFKLGKARDTAMIQKMVSLKAKKPDLKVLLSIGGWGGCENCSDGFFTAEKRKTFAASVKEVTDYFKTDGIDLDWEYPTIRLDNDVDQNPVHKTALEDKKNFTDLVQQLRNVLGEDKVVSFAAGGFNTYLRGSVEWKEVMAVVDFVNLMSYDLINGYSTETGHHTALYSTPKQVESTDNAVQYLLKIGVPSSKIIIGAAFYARVWENVPATNNGLYQSGKFKEGYAYNQFDTRMKGFKHYWDNVAKAPYSYNAEKKKFATYDDKKSIEIKTKYVVDNKLGGIMFWEISNDKYKNGLVDVISTTLSHYKR